MKITQKIEKSIQKIPVGTVFNYSNLGIEIEEYVTASKALERLQKKGVIKKVSKGVFYKPEKSVFGELSPNNQEIITPYLFEKGKRIAYITGMSYYNAIGLTTQVPNVIKIASRKKRIYISIKAIKAMPVKSYVEVTNTNYRYLQLLDALKDFNSILDIDKKSAITILMNKIKDFSSKEIQKVIKYVLEYPPRARAILGAILEQLDISEGLETIKNSLNPLTEYQYGFTPDELRTAKNWNIK
jgi:hypothetical protein